LIYFHSVRIVGIRRKSHQDAFMQYENDKTIGFLYLKVEEKLVDDVEPIICANKILKVGTFSVLINLFLINIMKTGNRQLHIS